MKISDIEMYAKELVDRRNCIVKELENAKQNYNKSISNKEYQVILLDILDRSKQIDKEIEELKKNIDKI